MSVLPNMRVFIADDSAVVRERLMETLSEIPHVEIIGWAEDGLQAIQSIREMKPDVAVLDIEMPRGTGLDVLKNLRHDKGGPIVIVFTNFPYPQYRKRALAEGADFFFDKSTEFEALRDLVHRMVAERQSHEAVE